MKIRAALSGGIFLVYCVYMNSAAITFTGRIPSLKNAKRIVRIHGRLRIVPSVAWNTYARFVKQNYPKLETPVTAPYEIIYNINLKGKGFQDIDNILAGINDLLQELNYITDDKHIYKVTANKVIGSDEYITHVEIKSLQC